MESPGTSPRPADAAPSRQKKSRVSAFRVCTVNDFNSVRYAGSDRRKAGQSTTACRVCRLRKVKCVLGESGRVEQTANQSQVNTMPQTCQPCKQANLDCRWDVVDGRRRRRARPSKRLSSQVCGTLSGAAADVGSPRQIPECSNQDISAAGTRCHITDDGLDNSQEIRSLKSTVNAPTAFLSTVRLQGESLDEAELDEAEPQRSQPFLAEIYSGDNAQLPQDWSDLQSFVLGFDFMGTSSLSPEPSVNIGSPIPGSLHAPLDATPRLVRLRYYRRFGPTAVIPGLRKLSVVVNPTEDEPANLQGVHHELEEPKSLWDQTPSPASAASQQSRIFDKNFREPHQDILPHILEVFFQKFGGHFPFLHPQILGGHVRSGEASSFLLNAIAALTVRFCSFEGPFAIIQDKYDVKWRRGSPFLKKAKEQLVPLLSIPAPEVVAGLLVLAWAEFGDNNETGLWMFAGIAIRMAQDLGFHRSPETDVEQNIRFHDRARPSPDGDYFLTDEESTTHQQKARLVMFWSVFITDICVSLVTGRQPTIRRSEIEVSVPTVHDMKLAQLDFEESVTMQNMIFPETVRFMLQFSETVETLNQRQPSRSTEYMSASTCLDREGHVANLASTLLKNYNCLSRCLVFNTENYRVSKMSSQSGLFLMLHLFFYTFMTLLSTTDSPHVRHGLPHTHIQKPSIPDNFQDLRGPILEGLDDRNQPTLAVMACQKIVQVMTIAELVDKTGYLATPFTNHCFFVAASTILQHVKILATTRDQIRASFLTSVANADYEFLYEKLQDQSKYFGGVNSVVAALDCSRKTLTSDTDGDLGSSGEEPENIVDRVVGLEDQGIVKRYTIPRQ